MDMWNRKIISYGMSKRSSAENIINAYRFKLKKIKYLKVCLRKATVITTQLWKISLEL